MQIDIHVLLFYPLMTFYILICSFQLVWDRSFKDISSVTNTVSSSNVIGHCCTIVARRFGLFTESPHSNTILSLFDVIPILLLSRTHQRFDDFIAQQLRFALRTLFRFQVNIHKKGTAHKHRMVWVLCHRTVQ